MKTKRRIKVLLSKGGLDGHDRGILIVASALRDAGMEVIYLGLHRTPEEIAKAAIKEDVDIVGISSLADAHMYFAPRVVEELRKSGGGNIQVLLGGLIRPEDIPILKEHGISVFPTSSRLDDIVRYIEEKVGS